MEAQVIGENEETHLLHIRCRKCSNSILALVLVNNVGVSSVGLVTDLTFEDVLRFRGSQRISTDDVLRAHEWLSKRDWLAVFVPATFRGSAARRRKTGSD
jgi:hypothetical protein